MEICWEGLNDTLVGTRWNIGNDKKVQFSWDCLVSQDKPLMFHTVSLNFYNIINTVDVDFIGNNGN